MSSAFSQSPTSLCVCFFFFFLAEQLQHEMSEEVVVAYYLYCTIHFSTTPCVGGKTAPLPNSGLRTGIGQELVLQIHHLNNLFELNVTSHELRFLSATTFNCLKMLACDKQNFI